MGLAYLPDGRRMDYNLYIRTEEWKEKRGLRKAIDGNKCGFCKEPLDATFETHHLNYSRLGNEDVEKDLISLCHRCHERFHNTWERTKCWETSGEKHWEEFSLSDTAKLCVQYKPYDYFFGGEYNLCNLDTAAQFIDKYFADNSIIDPIKIDINDIRLCFRNFRYADYLSYSDRGEKDEDYLNRKFGVGRVKGGNKKRVSAKAFITKHTKSSMRFHYGENEDIVTLMNEIKNLEEK